MFVPSSAIGQRIPVSDHLGDFNPATVHGLNQLILLPAGTGFTPMTKLTQLFLKSNPTTAANGDADGSKPIHATMLFFNKTPGDIMWDNQLDRLASSNPATFQVHHVLSQYPGWAGEKGRILLQILEKLLPSKNDDIKRLAGICGPIPFAREAKRYDEIIYVL